MKFDWLDEHKLAAGSIPANLAAVQVLQKQGIRAIVTLTEAPLRYQEGLSREILAEMGMETLHIPLADRTPPTTAQVRQVRGFIERMNAADKPVYIHCAAGIGRTGTMLHAIYMLNGMSLEEAKTLIRGKRPACEFSRLSPKQQRFLKELQSSDCG